MTEGAAVCSIDVDPGQRFVRLGRAWCSQHGDPNVGEWVQIDEWARSLGLDPGAPCLEQTHGGGHSTNSWHGTRRGATARDVSSRDRVAIASAAVPLARASDENVARYGHPYPIVELFCEEAGIRYSGGGRSNYRDTPDHSHLAKIPGIRLTASTPAPPKTKGHTMASFRYAHQEGKDLVTYHTDGVWTRRIRTGGINAAQDRTHLPVPDGPPVKAWPPALLDGGSTFLDDMHGQLVDVDKFLAAFGIATNQVMDKIVTVTEASEEELKRVHRLLTHPFAPPE